MKHDDFIKRLNDEILSKYDIVCDSLEKGEKDSVLAFYSPITNTIHINVLNKQIFNDYIGFIETMIHENVHKINNKRGIQDIYMEGEAQIHNRAFRDAMLEFGLYCDDKSFTGSVDFKESRNKEIFNQLVINKFRDKKVFDELQEIYLKEFYIETTDRNNKYVDDGKKYVFDEDEDGEEI